MMRISFLSRFILCLLMITSLCSCASEVLPQPKQPPEPKKISAEEYLLNLSIAKFECDEGASYKDIKPQIEVIESYTKAIKMPNKKNGANQNQTIVIVEFKRKYNDKTRLLAIPLQGIDSESEQYLKQATDRMQDKEFVVVSIKVASVELPGERNTVSGKRIDSDSYAKISAQINNIMKSRQPLDLLDEAKFYIHLCNFFMQIRFRDAAYIAMENAKQTLALASEKQDSDKDTINLLVKRINDMEIELHKNLPFSI